VKLWNAVYYTTIGVVAFGLAWVACACGGAQPPSQRVADCANAYAYCASIAEHAPEYQVCRARVDIRCLDGGAP
jgi:hypothetical protein